MNSAEMMKRCENALRTGQTENLFPVLARRTRQIIREEVHHNRREWAGLHPYYSAQVIRLNLLEMGEVMQQALTPTYRAASAVVDELGKIMGAYVRAFNAPGR